MTKHNKKSKILLISFAIIGALAIVAGSTAAVTIHSNSNSKSLTKSPTKASSDKNNNQNKGDLTPNSNPSSNNNPNSSNKSNNDGTKKSNSINNKKLKQNSSNNQTIINELNLLLNNIINVGSFNSMGQISAADALSDKKSLYSAIRDEIEFEINNSNMNLHFNSITYTSSQIAADISILLPSYILVSNNANAQIPGVILQYNNIALTASNRDKTFTIEGFSVTNAITTGINHNRNQSIINELDSLLNQTINVSSYETMNTITAAIALYSYKTNLKTAINDALENEISSKMSDFIFNNIAYTAKDIINELTYNLPNSVTLSENNNAQINNVTLNYNKFELTNISKTDFFIIQGFMKPNSSKSSSLNNNENRNQSVIKELNSLLKQNINVSSYNSMDKITAQDALSNLSTLDSAIKSVIQNEINSSIGKFTFYGLTYTATEILSNINIDIPTTLTTIDIENAAISNVNLSYANTLLMNTSNTSNFIVNGFKATVNFSQIESANQQIAKMIEKNVDNIIYNTDTAFTGCCPDSVITSAHTSVQVELLNYSKYIVPNPIILSGFSNIQASEALNIQSYKTQWINIFKNMIIGKNTQLFTFNGLTFTEQEIANNLIVNVNQWQFVNNYGEIQDITLSYAGINLNFSVSFNPSTGLYGSWSGDTLDIFGFINYESWQQSFPRS